MTSAMVAWSVCIRSTRLTQPVIVTGAPPGVVAVPGEGSDGVDDAGVVGCAGVLGGGAGGGGPGCVGGVPGCAGAGGCARSSADARVTLRIAVATATTSGRREVREVMSR